MGLYRTPGHLELFGNFRIVTALQQQIGDLLFPWTQPNWLIFHVNSSSGVELHNIDDTGVNSGEACPVRLSHPTPKDKQSF
jgi:hypothetical protein